MAKKSKKLPKAIAGVKLSKPVRKVGGKLLAAANSPQGREAIATGVAMLAAAAATRRAAARTKAPDAEAKPALEPEKVVDALGAVAASFLAGLKGAKPGG